MQNSIQLTQEAEFTRLRDLKQKAAALTGYSSILRHLYFDDMYKRADNIADATYGTFDWLLANGTASLNANEPEQASGDEYPGAAKQWYEERRQRNAAKISEFFEHGGGVFFLRGKPGSGKSTLMKYLTRGRGKREVDRKLRKWAGQKKLVCVSTMFSLHGTPLQRSLEGFYRTLLFELLCQCPDFMGTCFPKRFARELPDDPYRYSFGLEALQEAMERLIPLKQPETLRICISIDGMDELQGNSGDRLRFAQLLNEWAQSEDIKIICSGRPNAEFNIVFSQPHQTIDLQDLTRPDIRKILAKRFEGVRQFTDLTEENIQEFVDKISYQSEGVILWAVLVGKNIEDDIIHAKSLSAMQHTIQTLPSGIEELFDGMWQGLRQDPHQQLMLRTIYDLLTLYDGIYTLDAIRLSWLEEALSDDDFPYNKPIQILSTDELNARLARVRVQLVQYTKHFVEIVELNPSKNHILHRSRVFIHRSAQEFIQSRLDLIGSVPAPVDYIFHLDLRLSLIVQMSITASWPTAGIQEMFTKASYDAQNGKMSRQNQVHQIHDRFMEKLHELIEARRGFLSGNSTTDGSVDECWQPFELGHHGRLGTRARKKAFAVFHLAVDNHQINYVTRILNDRAQNLDREVVCLGLLICVAGSCPNYELFKLLVDHGADPASLIEVYSSGSESTPRHIPLWLLFCFQLAFKVSMSHFFHGARVSDDALKTQLSDEFLILERFLCLGYGFNVRFITTPFCGSTFRSLDNGCLGMELAQVVRLAKPYNMERLLVLLRPVPITFCSLVQRVASLFLQPQFPFRVRPQGADTIPYSTVREEVFIQQGMELEAAFGGEHEVECGGRYYVPGYEMQI